MLSETVVPDATVDDSDGHPYSTRVYDQPDGLEPHLAGHRRVARD